jgi:hypothetical protein
VQEIIEFRVPAENAACLPPGTADNIGYGMTRVLVEKDHPALSEIRKLHRAFQEEGKCFFSGWAYHRRYSRRELEESQLFHIWPKRTFEPAGQELGTGYDESSACHYVLEFQSTIEVGGRSVTIPRSTCGWGARQVTPLILDGRSIPRLLDFSRTIADELVVSRRTVEVFQKQDLTGAQFDPILLSNEGGKPSQNHYQLRVVGAQAELDAGTRAGGNPFDEDSYGRCPRGHILGLNLLSEVTIMRQSCQGADLMATRQMVGVRRGLLRPRPILLTSPKTWRAIEGASLKGFALEVAHFS